MSEVFSSKVVLVGAQPPPFHGQALVTQQVFEMDWSPAEVISIEARFSGSIEIVGTANFSKVKVLLRVMGRLLNARFFKGGKLLYITAGSANWVPLIRDVILIGCLGRLFPKVIVHYHSGGIPEWFARSVVARILGWFAYGGADVAIGLSLAVAVPCFRGTRQEILPNGIENPLIEMGEIRERVCRKLVFVGALRAGKGVDILLDAIENLAAKGYFDLELTLVGDWVSEDYRKKVQSRLKGEQLGRMVKVAGVLTGAAKWKVLKESDLFVFPTIYKSENQPLVVIEAMAMGIPVIASRWRGIPEMLVEGESGYLVEPHSVADLVAKIELVLGLTAGERNKIGQNARRRYQEQFSAQVFGARLKELVIGPRSSGKGQL